MSSEEFVSNDRLRQARNLKGWSQAELAEQVGTSFEMVSRWERGITVPSPHYRKRLSDVLGQAPEELGLVRDPKHSFTPPSSPFVLLASANADAEKTIVSYLKTTLKARGITFWSSRQIGKQRNGITAATLWEVVQAADALVMVISPQSRSSRHVREALELAGRYQRPVCGIWIEGERWEECLPEERVEFAAVIDAREGDTPGTLEEIATALAHLLFASQESTEMDQQRRSDTAMEVVTQTHHPTEKQAATNPPDRTAELVPLQSEKTEVIPPPSQHLLEPTNGARPMPTPPLPPAISPLPGNRMGFSRVRAGLLIGLTILVIAGALLGSLSLLTRFGVLAAHSRPSTFTPVHGGTWTDDLLSNPNSFIPGTAGPPSDGEVDQALYLPLFYGDAQGVIHAGAASEVPSVQNGDISRDGKTWTFHVRPYLVWSDGAPYDARDVDFTWKLWRNPTFGFAGDPTGLTLITSADVSADHLTITFHLTRAYAPFVANLWVDGWFAPLPAHQFSNVAPGALLKSPDNLNPQAVSGPFLLAESVPGDHYTLVRNPHYYLSRQGLPYLDKVVFRAIANPGTILKDLQAGTITSFWPGSGVDQVPQFQRLKNYTLLTAPSSASFEGMFFNFHNTVLASHLEVRQAMAMAIDQQALIHQTWYGFATPLCTDHGSAMHPGYDPNLTPTSCPVTFEPAVANQLLDAHGWVRGADGVRTKGRQRLEFEYSTTLYQPARHAVEAILQRNFMAIGIKLDIQNYPAPSPFFDSFLPGGKASPPSGAMAGRFDIAEYEQDFGYDPDDSWLLACDQIPSAANHLNGGNLDFYCNPELDALYQQELATADVGVRQGIFEQIHQIYLTQFPFIPLLSPSSFAIVHKGTHNYSLSPLVSAGETVNIWEWWCNNGKC
jgi:peptide/nickel transport system substrate-binding protein